MNLIESVFSKEVKNHSDIVREILTIDEHLAEFVSEEERSMPGNSKFIESGYYKTMLKRYFFAGAFFCRGKDVLDTCSGLGWGAHILSQYTHSLTAFDVDMHAVAFCKKTWNRGDINWLRGNALDLSFLNGKFFDVITGMETIEHFSPSETYIYIRNIRNSLRDRGVFIGTSSFPPDRKTADNLCTTNHYHKHIFTLSEIDELLSSFFSEHVIIDNWMFISRR
jgi:cyclopropane fatty-acyl-phospholipid synthase-like methyltransferase